MGYEQGWTAANLATGLMVPNPDLVENTPAIWYQDNAQGDSWMTHTMEHGIVGFPTFAAAFLYVWGAISDEEPPIYQVSDEARAELRRVGANEYADAYSAGYSCGADDDVRTPSYANEALSGAFELGVFNRREFNRLREQLEAASSLESDRIREARDERDTLSQSVDMLREESMQMQREIVRLREQVETVERERDDWKQAATPEGSDLIERLRATEANREQMVARNEELLARIDALINNVRAMEGDWDTFAEAFLDEAVRRDWCSDYESFCDRLSGSMRHFSFLSRTKTYRARVWVELRFEVDHNQDEDSEANERRDAIANFASGRYDVADYGVEDVEVEDD
jgi:hypothetical protein